MMTIPFTMTDERRAELLAWRTNPKRNQTEFWPSYDDIYCVEYPAQSLKDDFGDSYMIWRDTATDKITQITICIQNKELYTVKMEDSTSLIHPSKKYGSV